MSLFPLPVWSLTGAGTSESLDTCIALSGSLATTGYCTSCDTNKVSVFSAVLASGTWTWRIAPKIFQKQEIMNGATNLCEFR